MSVEGSKSPEYVQEPVLVAQYGMSIHDPRYVEGAELPRELRLELVRHEFEGHRIESEFDKTRDVVVWRVYCSHGNET